MAASAEWTSREAWLHIDLPIYGDSDEELEQEAERCRLAALGARSMFPPDYPSPSTATFTRVRQGLVS